MRRTTSSRSLFVLVSALAAAPLLAAPAHAQSVAPDDAPRAEPLRPAPQPYPAAPPQPYQPPQYYQAPPQPYPPQYPPPGQYPAYANPYYAPAPIEYEMRPRYGLGIAGLSLFGGTYLFTAVFGGIGAQEGVLWAPVIGPAIYAGQYNNRPSCNGYIFNGGPYTSGQCAYDSDKRTVTSFMVLDTLMQATGVVMAIVGFGTKHKVAVARPRFSIAPSLSPALAGVVAMGTF